MLLPLPLLLLDLLVGIKAASQREKVGEIWVNLEICRSQDMTAIN